MTEEEQIIKLQEQVDRLTITNNRIADHVESLVKTTNITVDVLRELADRVNKLESNN